MEQPTRYNLVDSDISAQTAWTIAKDSSSIRYIIIIDGDSQDYFAYELKRAASELKVMVPQLLKSVYFIKYTVARSGQETAVTVHTNGRRVTTRIPSAASILRIIHNEILRLPSNVLYSSRIFLCPLISPCSYLRILDPMIYSNAVFCLSVGAVVKSIIGSGDVNGADYPQYAVDAQDFTIEKIVREFYHYKHSNDLSAAGACSRFIALMRSQHMDSVIKILRDPRFELLTNMRFNPWLYEFEQLASTGKCRMLINRHECPRPRCRGMNYCIEHMCTDCSPTCRHVRDQPTVYTE